jgi:hypothetical protein
MKKSGRLALIKSMSAIPIRTCLILDMPPWFIKALNKILKAFLWTGTDVMWGGGGALWHGQGCNTHLLLVVWVSMIPSGLA